MRSTYDGVFSDPDGELLSDASLDSVMIAGGATQWYRTQPGETVQDGRKITRLNSVHVVDADSYFTQATGTKQALLTAGTLGRFPTALMDGTDDHWSMAGAPDWNSTYSVVTLYKPTVFDADRCIWGNFTDSDDRSYLTLSSTGVVSAVHGGQAASQAVGVVVLNDWNLTIQAFDGVSIFNRTNGVEVSAAFSTGSGGDGTTCLGSLNTSSQFFKGYLSDMIIFAGVCVFDDPALVDAIDKWGQSYGVAIA